LCASHTHTHIYTHRQRERVAVRNRETNKVERDRKREGTGRKVSRKLLERKVKASWRSASALVVSAAGVC